MKLLYINAGSIKNKYLYLNDYIVTHNFDIVAICETWLGSSDYDDTCVNGLLPDTYRIHRVDRDDGRRGGGVALIYKESLSIKSKETVKFSQFEFIMCSLIVKNQPTIICVVYRPPPSPTNNLNTNTFMTEWADFLSQYTMKTAELIIVGDINIHLDDATHHHTTDMMQTLHSYGLKQHIHEATHYCGHTLDVPINRDCSTLLSAIDVKDIGLCDDKGNPISMSNNNTKTTRSMVYRNTP